MGRAWWPGRGLVPAGSWPCGCSGKTPKGRQAPRCPRAQGPAGDGSWLALTHGRSRSNAASGRRRPWGLARRQAGVPTPAAPVSTGVVGTGPLGTRLPGHHHERRPPREDLSCSPATLASRKQADGNGSGRHGAARCTRSTETKTKTPPPKGKEMYKQCRKEKGLDVSTIRTLLNGERKM